MYNFPVQLIVSFVSFYKNTCLTSSLPGQPGLADTGKVKPFCILTRQEMMGVSFDKIFKFNYFTET